MFSRFRAGVAGEGPPQSQSSPPSSPRRQPPQALSSPPGQQQHAQQSPHPQPQRGGLLSPLFFSNNNHNTHATSSPRPPALPLTHHHHENQNQQQPQSFFGGLFSSTQAATQPPPPSTTEASPRSIRASASALLKMATPPPFTSSTTPTNYSASTNHSPNRQHNRSRTADHKNTTPTTEEYDDDDDRDTLEYQLQHRENHISKLASDLQKLQSYTLQYQRDIHTLRRQQLESSFRHRVSTKLWRRTNEGLSARCACYQNELTSEAAREIANLIRDAAPPNKDSTYLMMLQDQLNKATLKLSHLSNQTEIILSKGEEVIESLRTEMNEVIRERCKMELELLDNIHGMEEDMKRMVNRTERRLKRVQGEIDFLEKNAVEVLKSKEVDDDEKEHEDDDDDSEEDDDAADDEEEDKSEEDRAEVGDEEGTDGEKGSTLEDRELMTDANDEGAGASAEDGEGDQQVKEECANTEVAEGDKACEDNNMSHNDKVGVKDNQQRQQQQQQKDERHKQHTPENLRSELRKLATDRDATLSILQKKLREKNEEFQTLLKSKKGREETINKLESVRRDREEWERSREDGISSTI